MESEESVEVAPSAPRRLGRKPSFPLCSPSSSANDESSRLLVQPDDEQTGSAQGMEQKKRSVSSGPSTARIGQLLRNVSFIKDIDSKALHALSRTAQPIEVGRGEAVIREGEPGDSLFVVMSGSFSVFAQQAGGRRKIFTFAQPGQYFGEVCVLEPGQVRTATVEATTSKAMCVRLKREHVLPILTEQISKVGKESLVQKHRDGEEDLHDAPTWLETPAFSFLETVYLARSWQYWALYSLLCLAPFAASAGRFTRIIYGCPEHSIVVDLFMSTGIFMFCLVWPFLLDNFSAAVRGASRIQNRLETEDARARAVVLAANDVGDDQWMSLPAAVRYRALTAVHGCEEASASESRHRFRSEAFDAAVTTTAHSSPDLSESLEVDSINLTGPHSSTSETRLHVRGVGHEGWDGTVDGRGIYESPDALRQIFSEFGSVLHVQIRHRIEDGANTSWALVTMETAGAVEAVLAASAIMAGSTKLKVTRFDEKHAATSTGMMRKIADRNRQSVVNHANHLGTAMDSGYQVHVRGVGHEGWDGTVDGRGIYESPDALRQIFSEFGSVLHVQIRHRIEDGANTSWALVTMETAGAVEAVLAASAIMAGSTKLKVTRFDKKQAATSTGMMRQVSRGVVKAVLDQRASTVASMFDKRESALAREQSIFEAKRNTMREALANIMEIECEILVGNGGYGLTRADEDLLHTEFDEADVDGSGELGVHECISLIQGVIGYDFSDRDKQNVANTIRVHDIDGNGELSFDEFVQLWNDQTEGAPGRGILFHLSCRGGLGIERQKLTSKHHRYLTIMMWLDCILGALSMFGAVWILIGTVEFLWYGHAEWECKDCALAGGARFLLNYEAQCVPRAVFTTTAIGMLLVFAPASLTAAVLWPLWLLSLQTCVTFAAADINAVEQQLRPRNVRSWQVEALIAREKSNDQQSLSRGEMRWQTDVALPGALLVSTMKRLSKFGSSLGMSIVGCSVFGIGMLPNIDMADSEWKYRIAILVGVMVLPALVALQPAYLTSNCIQMHEQLNGMTLMGDDEIKTKVTKLRMSFEEANNRQGMGFVMMGQVINVRMLLTYAFGLYTVGSTVMVYAQSLRIEQDSDVTDFACTPCNCNSSAGVT